MIKDMLFILKEICYQTFPKSSTQTSSEDPNDMDCDAQMPTQGAAPTAAANESQSKENSKKKKSVPTMNQAVSSLFPSILISFIFNKKKTLIQFSAFSNRKNDLSYSKNRRTCREMGLVFRATNSRSCYCGLLSI